MEQILMASMLLFLYGHQVEKPKRWHFDRIIARKLVADSWPSSSQTWRSYLHAYRPGMIKSMLDDASVGYYRLLLYAYRSHGICTHGDLHLSLPSIVKARMTNSQAFEQKLQGLYDLLLWIGVLQRL